MAAWREQQGVSCEAARASPAQARLPLRARLGCFPRFHRRSEERIPSRVCVVSCGSFARVAAPHSPLGSDNPRQRTTLPRPRLQPCLSGLFLADVAARSGRPAGRSNGASRVFPVGGRPGADPQAAPRTTRRAVTSDLGHGGALGKRDNFRAWSARPAVQIWRPRWRNLRCERHSASVFLPSP